jgi:hypothetical protein
MTGGVLSGCQQHIDGVVWQNVVFLNARIIYGGGPLTLEDVTVVNCTFTVERNNDGFRLLQYATLLDRGLLKIGTNPAG